jgi:FixJ family two-component response regulator
MAPASGRQYVKAVDPIVFVVDDDASMREALANLITSVSLRVECFASSTEFLRRDRSESPSCLVLDVRLPGLSGLELQRRLAHAQPPIPIIFISAYGDISLAVHAMKAGAVEFLPKPFRDEELLGAIRQALERDQTARAEGSKSTRVREHHAQLTARQRQVMSAITRGRLNKQIGAELGLSENTIKVDRRHIMQIMGALSFADLVRMSAQLL